MFGTGSAAATSGTSAIPSPIETTVFIPSTVPRSMGCFGSGSCLESHCVMRAFTAPSLCSSGSTYVATGAQDVLQPGPPPITPQGFALTPQPPPIFQLEGTDSCAGQAQLPVNFNLIFDSSGHLLSGSSASLGQCTTDLGCTGG